MDNAAQGQTVLAYCHGQGLPLSGCTVTVTDCCNNLVYQGRTDAEGQANFCVPIRGRYRVEVAPPGQPHRGACPRWLWLSPCQPACLLFALCLCRVPPAQFYLTDRNYPGLSIEKGALCLWANPM